MRVLTAVFASLLLIGGAVLIVMLLRALEPPAERTDTTDVALLIGGSGVVCGAFMLTVLAVTA